MYVQKYMLKNIHIIQTYKLINVCSVYAHIKKHVLFKNILKTKNTYKTK